MENGMNRACFVLADELIDAARNEDREPGTIFSSDVKTALVSIALQLHRRGVPLLTTATMMRDCARSLEVDQWWLPPEGQDRQLTVNAAREALVEQLRRMESLVQRRQDDHRLPQACETVRAELAALDEGGGIDRAEAMVRLAGMLCDAYVAEDEVPFWEC
jgi:hypothetical protein